ncbi:DUF72 domain-containing protein [Sphingomonas crusticola]|uniref:DUF72 domain-containing protein n=1 Tax=Sphingomonas crusticola TaxID=1697973 RepID=UPI000E277242|nr:DUF72 domain-containing protein [Sphingomonas crusticola]
MPSASPAAWSPAIVGTAGWTIPVGDREAFPAEGTSLERYSARLHGAEINSSFHRRHRPATWANWARSVPAGFRFAVKLPKEISHQRKLVDCGEILKAFLDETGALGDKLAILLLQLPPKLAFAPEVATPFLTMLTRSTNARIVCEPRHPSWFEPEPDALLDSLGIARVAADPAPIEAASFPGGWRGLSYWRLHGSPHMYRSPYGPERLAQYANLLQAERAQGRPVWCIFDNTASSAAMGDALILRAQL